MKITLGVAVAALAIGGLHYYKNADSKVQNIEETEEVAKVNPVGPSFNADSAYAFTKAQCDFGPRDMNSRGHDLCGEWIVSKFKEYGCKVTTQTATLVTSWRALTPRRRREYCFVRIGIAVRGPTTTLTVRTGESLFSLPTMLQVGLP